ncbi:hypothetical protein [Caldimonas sp. KR1-144]|uniref:hypothetical protein n=1 Tax=Caldimonas sp. KR1-144 TaxID=3400911 RepID=UPI003BFFC92E
MSNTIAWLNERLTTILARYVEPLFKPGTKLTIIARTPDNNEADILVSSDDLDAVIALIERSKHREPIQ